MFLEKFAQRFEVAPSRIGLPKGQGQIVVWQALRDCGMDRDAMDNECVFVWVKKKKNDFHCWTLKPLYPPSRKNTPQKGLFATTEEIRYD